MQSFAFHPAVARWFETKFGSPTEPQERGWPVIQSGQHTLISAPTGSGKTLAAFLATLDQLFREGASGQAASPRQPTAPYPGHHPRIVLSPAHFAIRPENAGDGPHAHRG